MSDADTQDRIKSLVQQHRVILFMKGTKDQPMCGFSARALQVVKALDVPFETVDVLADPAVREGVKVYSNWPTLPQLFVDGQLVGGSDIVYEMYESGDLQKLVEGHAKAP
jgi:monothiol glutaredoxin